MQIIIIIIILFICLSCFILGFNSCVLFIWQIFIFEFITLIYLNLIRIQLIFQKYTNFILQIINKCGWNITYLKNCIIKTFFLLLCIYIFIMFYIPKGQLFSQNKLVVQITCLTMDCSKQAVLLVQYYHSIIPNNLWNYLILEKFDGWKLYLHI